MLTSVKAKSFDTKTALALTRLEGIIPCKTILIIESAPDCFASVPKKYFSHKRQVKCLQRRNLLHVQAGGLAIYQLASP